MGEGAAVGGEGAGEVGAETAGRAGCAGGSAGFKGFGASATVAGGASPGLGDGAIISLVDSRISFLGGLSPGSDFNCDFVPAQLKPPASTDKMINPSHNHRILFILKELLSPTSIDLHLLGVHRASQASSPSRGSDKRAAEEIPVLVAAVRSPFPLEAPRA